jgi:arsenite methyltransferase
MLVCGNTAAMVAETRYAAHFRVLGDTSQHFGLFDCGPSPVAVAAGEAVGGSCC